MKPGFLTSCGIFFIRIVAKLPFPVIYFFSDVFFIIVFYLIPYRKKIVFRNLRNSFPEKTEHELKTIARKFYHHFCDLAFETMKMNQLSPEEIHKRIKIANPEVLNQFAPKGMSVTVLTFHYNNWEWGATLASYFNSPVFAVYRPLNNLQFDQFMNSTRAKYGCEMVKESVLLRKLISAEKQNQPVIIWLAADQTPHIYQDAWYIFLNQESMFFPGPVFISKRFNTPVIFQKIEKTKRGYYTVSFELLIENPATKNETEIIKLYIEKMESAIREKPEYYLWTHNRWKRQRPTNVPLQR